MIIVMKKKKSDLILLPNQDLTAGACNEGSFSQDFIADKRHITAH